MSLGEQATHRLRVTYGVDRPLQYVSVLDLARVWARLLKRAGVPVAYSQGYNPHPRLQMASVLPLGYTSECEIMDVLLTEEMPPQSLLDAIANEVPAGLRIYGAQAVPLKSPAPQSQFSEAEYRVTVWGALSADALDRGIANLLQRDEVIRERKKHGKLVSYDLRPLIHYMERQQSLVGMHTLFVRMAHSSMGSGRPEEALAEMRLAIDSQQIHRLRLVWAQHEE